MKKVIGVGKEKKYLTGEEEENSWCVKGYFRGSVDQYKLLLNDGKKNSKYMIRRTLQTEKIKNLRNSRKIVHKIYEITKRNLKF